MSFSIGSNDFIYSGAGRRAFYLVGIGDHHLWRADASLTANPIQAMEIEQVPAIALLVLH